MTAGRAVTIGAAPGRPWGWRRMTAIAAVLVWAAALLSLAIGLATTPSNGPTDLPTVVAGILAVLSPVSVGAVLVVRLPRNPIGWLLLLSGLLIGISSGASGLAEYGLTSHPGSVPGAIWIALLSQMTWVPFIVGLGFYLPLLYPSGRLPSRRWRPVGVLGVIAIVFSTIHTAFSPFSAGSLPAGVQNPLAVGDPMAQIASALGAASNVIGVVALPLVAASLVLRYRHAAAIERQQLKWLAAVTAIVGPALAVGIATGGDSSGLGAEVSNAAWLIVTFGFGLAPVAIGIAVLRYRLYDIDVIIRRSAVYIPLTATLAGVYAASIAAFQRLFIAVTGNPSDGAVILSTLILATTFTPIKSALQSIVDRHFRDALDGRRRLQAFTDSLVASPWALDPARTMRAFLSTSVDALGAMGGRAYVGVGDDERLAGATGSPPDSPPLSVPVEAAGSRIGRLELDARRGGRPIGDADVEALTEAGARLGRTLLGLVDVSPDPAVPIESRFASVVADTD